jgi:hypothetical protein
MAHMKGYDVPYLVRKNIVSEFIRSCVTTMPGNLFHLWLGTEFDEVGLTIPRDAISDLFGTTSD